MNFHSHISQSMFIHTLYMYTVITLSYPHKVKHRYTQLLKQAWIVYLYICYKILLILVYYQLTDIQTLSTFS